MSDGFTERELGEPIHYSINNEVTDKPTDINIDLSKLDNNSNTLNLSVISELIDKNKYKRTRWTEEELQVLSKLYSKLSINDLKKVFPSRSNPSIKAQAYKLGLTNETPNYYWSKSEEDILKENYSKKSVKEIQKIIPRHTVSAILNKAFVLDLKKGYLNG